MIVTKRESMASLIHDTSPTLRHSLQQSHYKGLYYGFRDAILSRLVTIIKRLVHHTVYCYKNVSFTCLLSFFLLLLAVRIIERNNNFFNYY